jgi:hypothetical protein
MRAFVRNGGCGSAQMACLLAEACARAGRPDKGLALLSEIPKHALEMVYSSEIYRSRGELLLSQGHAHAPQGRADHRPHGPLTADATEPAWNGYLLTVACPCGVVFEGWVTLLDAELDLLRLARLN